MLQIINLFFWIAEMVARGLVVEGGINSVIGNSPTFSLRL